ncbi:MAG: transporter [Desulfobacterales bacterium]|jgi:anthranilate 1,2-dioxygenase (deaminating, decarboxylating) large subunit|nr:transporter [Desulfobacterales bacterium]MCU0561776.1 transporter [Desulfobacterales bacterium]
MGGVRGFLCWAIALLAGLGHGTACAYDLPAVNLGATSFMDGGPPSGPGLYLSQYFQYYTSNKFTDSKGDKLLPGSANEELDVWVSLTQMIYQSDQALLFGGKWGLNLIVPLVSFDLDYGNNGPYPEDNGAGLGDVNAGVFLQWDPVMGPRGPIFMHRIELTFLLPTGKYDSEKELNPGSNFFSFNPYWSGTLFLTPEWTFSTRIHYLYNFKNNDPNRAFAGAGDSQAGQAVHLNFATSYGVLPNLKLGINGYYLKQFTDLEVDGDSVDNSREQVFAIGPGLLWMINKDASLFLNMYVESMAENRPEGERFNLRFVYHF